MNDHFERHAGAARSGDVKVFSDYLRESDQPFLILDEPGGQQVRVRFTGSFQGRDVVWDCHFTTLNVRRKDHTGSTERDQEQAPRNFIEIDEPGASGIPIRVGLDLPFIDMPAIRKMIIMVRNYKGLHRGRHEFGEQSARSRTDP
jgi:hypothetical protein